MLTGLRRGVVVCAGSAALLLAGPGRAWAGDDIWGAVDCDQGPVAGCELFAVYWPDRAYPLLSPPRGPGTAKPPVRCSYERADRGPPTGATASGAPHGEGPGGWYVYRCPGSADSGPVWLQDSAGGGGQGASVPALAREAYRQLRLPSPAIRSSPPGPQLVHLPSWLWIEPDSWGPRSATVSVPGVVVTATATPARVVWSMGDGGQVVCTSPGTPYSNEADPASASPDCGHTYRVASTGRPGGVFRVVASTVWTVTWSAAGQGGEFPALTTTSTTAMRVVESPAVNTR